MLYSGAVVCYSMTKCNSDTQIQSDPEMFLVGYRLLLEMNVTKVISKNVLVKSSEKTLSFYLYFTWLCGS